MKADNKPPRRSLVARLWATLASMKFAIWLLIILAVISVFGLFVEEFLPDHPSSSSWAQFVWSKLGQRGMTFLQKIGLTRPFHAPWYRFLVVLLSVSLFVCLIQRIPGILRRLARGPAHLGRNAIQALPLHATVTAVSREALAANWPSGFNRREEKDETGQLWRGERGQYAHLGSVLTHLGMFLLAVGALLASLGVREFQVGAFPGDTITDREIPFAVRVDSFRLEYYPLAPGQTVLVGEEFLGRTLKQTESDLWLVEVFRQRGVSDRIEVPASMLKNRFDHEYDSGNISDYIASVSVLEENQVVHRAHIEVNHPLRHKGWRVYQSSYEPGRPRVLARFDTAFVQVMRASDSTIVGTIHLPMSGLAHFADTYSMRAAGFYPDYRRASGEDYSLSAQMNNPAVRVNVFRGADSLGSTVLFQRFAFHGGFDDRVPFLFQIVDFAGPVATEELRTILQFRRDQGVTVIWAGFIIMTVGLVLAFYLVHRQFWVRLEPLPDGRMQAVIGAECTRGAHHFEREFHAVISRMKQEGAPPIVRPSS
jgi:cytochrome c biogenesis protein